MILSRASHAVIERRLQSDEEYLATASVSGTVRVDQRILNDIVADIRQARALLSSSAAGGKFEQLIQEMRMIGAVAGQVSVEGPQDTKALMAAAEAERALRWAALLADVLGSPTSQDQNDQEVTRVDRQCAPTDSPTVSENHTTPATAPLETPRHKGVYIGAPACFALEEAIRHVCEAFDVYGGGHISGCYVVGSCLERQDWRDVDVRLLLDDAQFLAAFPGATLDHWEHDARWLLLTVSISERLSRLTGLPIDFQFQPRTPANARHKGQRNAIGIRISHSDAGDKTTLTASAEVVSPQPKFHDDPDQFVVPHLLRELKPDCLCAVCAVLRESMEEGFWKAAEVVSQPPQEK